MGIICAKAPFNSIFILILSLSFLRCLSLLWSILSIWLILTELFYAFFPQTGLDVQKTGLLCTVRSSIDKAGTLPCFPALKHFHTLCYLLLLTCLNRNGFPGWRSDYRKPAILIKIGKERRSCYLISRIILFHYESFTQLNSMRLRLHYTEQASWFQF